MPKKYTLGDLFSINKPGRKRFYTGETDAGIKCWPLTHGQGCYGDCMDCFRIWEDRLDGILKLPLNMLSRNDKENIVGKDGRQTLGYIIHALIEGIVEGEAKPDLPVAFGTADSAGMYFLSIYMINNDKTVAIDIGDGDE